jgi:hypothetical protein
MAEGGCFAQVLSLGDLSADETVSVMCTFSSVFKHCLLWRNGGDCLMLGQSQDFRLELESISERLNRPEIQKTLRECAPPGEKPYMLDNFISGILLTDADFRKVATGGVVYTDDKPGLRFTTGHSIDTGNIHTLHDHLSPWRVIKELFDGFPDFEKRERFLAANREYFLALLYKQQPREFYEVFLRFIEEYSLSKESDLALLRSYLLSHGMTREAEDVMRKIETAKRIPEVR